MRVAQLAALATLALLTLPVAPAGALEDHGGSNLASDVFVDGGKTYFTRFRGNGQREVIEATAQAQRRLALLPSPGSFRYYLSEEFAASAARWIWGYSKYERSEIEDEDLGGQVLVGAPGGPTETPFDCKRDPTPLVAVSGAVDANQPAACPQSNEGGRGIEVRDHSPGAAVPSREILLTEQVDRLDLAGRYVAYGLQGQIVVYDWVTGAEAYRVSSSAAAPLHGSGAVFDLQDDGKVVAPISATAVEDERRPPCEDKLGIAWFSPSEPTAHVLPVKACKAEMRLRGDRIAFGRSFLATGVELVVADLSGNAVTPVARVRNEALLHSFDFDGTRVAFARDGCYVHRVGTEGFAPAPKPSSFGQPKCPIRIAASAGRVTSKGAARVRVECPAGCEMTIEPTSYEGETVREARIAPGKAKVFSFGLPDGLLARLRAGRRQTIRVLARNDRVPAKVIRFSRTVTVLPR